ncbi:tRNA (N6-threonylcarbamoyladenosine(37)-N6)-methyltransferase TrmO [Fictibacillus sp. BK138]|uniref:tRNA (N6-threonylcarbamoyladenosine(37)-N6)-methyltransferase TrmO n=1 Tax=Fictibacillus sp. BK138 TaxID=2512121 RepID=UPI0010289F76|nr:tRNA (N6-threonylcarbamoyladenosine(37)-N6)-methyltransferase TrmO [Fictibacillus sp. BK138]RZT15527.1 tRNA-Thr(GGU) m(6)t(6)A37 methyltransferase TsaA [Fictibacillus sp. BK138]
MDSIELKELGTVCSNTEERTKNKWRDLVSKILIHPAYLDGLAGLDEYSHAIVIFYMVESGRENPTRKKVSTPHGDTPLRDKGYFAQRTKHRPNPIGITAVEIISVTEDALYVKGLDANSGTSVLDIKPYIPSFDRREDVQIPSWMKKLMKNYTF